MWYGIRVVVDHSGVERRLGVEGGGGGGRRRRREEEEKKKKTIEK